MSEAKTARTIITFITTSITTTTNVRRYLAYLGLTVGDLVSGVLSQLLRSRKKVVLLFLCLTLGFVGAYLNLPGLSASQFYTLCFCLGFASGYWAIFVTMGAEQFGTNLRATAATTIPNMVRGSLPLIVLLFKDLLQVKMGKDILVSGMITGAVVIVITLVAAWFTEETFTKDLNYIEEP